MEAIHVRRRIGTALFGAVAVAICVYPQLAQAHDSASEAIAGVPGRTRLEICVAGADGSAPPRPAVKAVGAALEQVRGHRHFKAAGLEAGGGPRLVAGCPGPPAMRTKAGANRVDHPGRFHTYVYVVSEDVLGGMAFKGSPAVAAQERVCDDDVCASVANAVYVTEKDLADPTTLARALRAGVGLPPDDGDETPAAATKA
ncbi:MAG: hypothetical protein QOI99_2218 [Actinomycetota bacterium]|nr:hypothetical protein [Actinomycetota bacterium]